MLRTKHGVKRKEAVETLKADVKAVNFTCENNVQRLSEVEMRIIEAERYQQDLHNGGTCYCLHVTVSINCVIHTQFIPAQMDTS